MFKFFLLAILFLMLLTVIRVYFFLKKNLKVYKVDYKGEETGHYSPRIGKEKDISDKARVISEE